MSISSIFDKVTAHIQALKTLGVKTENCTTMLYPLVESSLPEEVLRTWQRSTACNNALAEGTVAPNRLQKLLNSLQSEVENEERINIAVSGFSVKPANRKEPTEEDKPKLPSSPKIPSASVLLCSEERRNKCIFVVEIMKMRRVKKRKR
ncbi:hypothetical protein QAD02_020793 [Eretmocerus hayati]|uniref:Uncharacterized protein n=1 Tax=Eretmocerus hayati TaxID=131215 RepID=A0ACC2PN18_9HYME|nr:hypothetical protein QAD02_020793 [Eretmocerus hayati]